MQNNRLLTPIEIRYAKKQMRGIRIGYKYVKLIFLFVLLMGIFALFTIDIPLIGLFFFFIGLAGYVFFHHFSETIEFTILPETAWIKGRLKLKRIGSLNNGGGYAPFLGNHLLYCPAVIASMLGDIAMSKKQVNVELALCEYKKINEKALFHIPLRVENMLCIQNALNKYGLSFVFIPALLFVIKSLLAIVLFILFVISVMPLIELLNEPWNIILLLISILPLLFVASWLSHKIIPYDENIIKKKLECE